MIFVCTLQRARPLEINPNRSAAVRARAEFARLHRLRLVMRHIEQKVFIVGITAPALDTHRYDYWDSVLVGHGGKSAAVSSSCKPEYSHVAPPFQ
jgi:hypothetical protein